MLPASHGVLAGSGGPKPVARDYAWRGRRLRLGEVLRGLARRRWNVGRNRRASWVRDRRNWPTKWSGNQTERGAVERRVVL